MWYMSIVLYKTDFPSSGWNSSLWRLVAEMWTCAVGVIENDAWKQSKASRFGKSLQQAYRVFNSGKPELAEISSLFLTTRRGNQDCRVGVGVERNRRFLGGVTVGLLTTLGVVYFVRLRIRKSKWIIFYITLISWELLLKWYNFYETFAEAENSRCVSRFPLIANCYKIVDCHTSLTLFWRGRSYSQTFYLRHRNSQVNL